MNRIRTIPMATRGHLTLILLTLLSLTAFGCSESDGPGTSTLSGTPNRAHELANSEPNKLSALDFTIGKWREYSQQLYPEQGERIETGTWECKRDGNRLVSHLNRNGEAAVLHFYYDESDGKLVSETVGKPEYTMRGEVDPKTKSVTFKMDLNGERHVFETMPVGKMTVSTFRVYTADEELVQEWRIENEPIQ